MIFAYKNSSNSTSTLGILTTSPPINTNHSSFECKVCSDIFSSQGLKVPRLLNCGHTLCHACLCHLYQTGHGSVVCPFDRQTTIIAGETGVWGLKKNFALIEFIEKLHNQQQCSPTKNSPNTAQSISSPIGGAGFQLLNNEKMSIESETKCDEVDTHTAVVFCIVCESHLCIECSERTHQTKTLSRHRRVPLSEKPQPRSKCTYHSAYALEFVCLEPACTSSEGNRLMCLLCRDYGKHAGHKHSLLEPEASKLREDMKSAINDCRQLSSESQEWAEQVARATYQIERADGTADYVKRQVRKHFNDLRRLILIQETAALTVVESHIRERLIGLRTRQDELVVLGSLVVPLGGELEQKLRADDAKIIERQHETELKVDSVKKQKEQLTMLLDQLNLDTRIHVSFTKDNRLQIGPKIEMRVVTLGLDGTGKSTILFKLKQNESLASIPTIGFNVETLEYKNLKLTIWDVGGMPKLRPLWKHYYLNTQAIIFVVDTTDRERLAEVQCELVKLLSENELKDSSLLIYANKQDLAGSMSTEELMTALTLSKLCYGRSWYLQPCDAISGYGLWEGLEWLTRQLVSASVDQEDDDSLDRNHVFVA